MKKQVFEIWRAGNKICWGDGTFTFNTGRPITIAAGTYYPAGAGIYCLVFRGLTDDIFMTSNIRLCLNEDVIAVVYYEPNSSGPMKYTLASKPVEPAPEESEAVPHEEKICKNCKWWERVEHGGEWIRSVCPKAFDGIHGDVFSEDTILLEGWVHFDIPSDFGCIHFEPKADKPKIKWKYPPGC